MTLKQRMNDIELKDGSPCNTCARKTGPFTCEAFPEEIPMVFVRGDNWHRQPYPGDRGLQYVKEARA